MILKTAKIIHATALAAALTLAAAAVPAGAQDAGDEYEMLSAEVGRQQTVSVLVTGWHPVTGDESKIAASAEGGGLVAVTGDKFVKAVEGRGGVTEVRRYENLPVIAMKVDAAGLAAMKSYDAGVRIWRDLPVVTYLDDSGPMVGAHKAHQGGYTGKGTFVAVVDTGIDVDHPFHRRAPGSRSLFFQPLPQRGAAHGRTWGRAAGRPPTAPMWPASPWAAVRRWPAWPPKRASSPSTSSAGSTAGSGRTTPRSWRRWTGSYGWPGRERSGSLRST